MNDKIKIRVRLGAMLAFIVGVYLPFLIILMIKYDVVHYTLSAIGWREGGFVFLLIYIVITVPSIIYQIFSFLNLSSDKNTLLKILIFAGGILIAIGALFPVKTQSPQYSHILHQILCQAGGILSIISVTYMVILYVKEHKNRVRNVVVLYGELFIIVVVAFSVLNTAALFEVGASFLFLIAMFVINGILIFQKEKDKNNRE